MTNRNLTDSKVAALPTTGASSPEYWTAPVVLAFESDTARDGDPLSDAFIFGVTNGTADARQPKIAVYSETIRDYRDTPLASPPAPANRVSPDEIMRNATAHEILHLFGLIHDGSRTQGGIMCAPLYVDANEPNRTKVTPNQLKQLRQTFELKIQRDSRDCP